MDSIRRRRVEPPARKRKRTKRPLMLGALAGVLIGGGLLGVALFRGDIPNNFSRNLAVDRRISDEPAHGSPLKNTNLFVDPNSAAAKQAAAWRASSPEQAATMDRLAALPTAKWLTSAQSLDGLPAYLAAAKAAKAVPVLVAYNIPLRDCGKYSAGGANVAGSYQAFIGTLAERIGDDRTVVILEPDALANIDGVDTKGSPCLTDQQKTTYYTLLRDAVERLEAQPGTMVYLDAGNSAWVTDPVQMVARLQNSGIAKADGFSLNVSNFQPTVDTIAYGEAVAGKLGAKHFVIDTSRNGLGGYTNAAYPDFNWCNPPGRALGHFPTTSTGHSLIDAYLYIKYPGESDGQDPNPNKCFGGPTAGGWWPEYALGLIERWPHDLQPR